MNQKLFVLETMYLKLYLKILFFFEAQVYVLKNSDFYQDNQWAKKIENIRGNLCTRSYRRVHISYFFAKDRVYKGELEIQYFHTEIM